MVVELLEEGRENARNGKTLAAALGITLRELTAVIEKERRDGAPICAANGEPYGYFIAANAEELAEYCESIKGRAIELFKTRQAMIKAGQTLPAAPAQDPAEVESPSFLTAENTREPQETIKES